MVTPVSRSCPVRCRTGRRDNLSSTSRCGASLSYGHCLHDVSEPRLSADRVPNQRWGPRPHSKKPALLFALHSGPFLFRHLFVHRRQQRVSSDILRLGHLWPEDRQLLKLGLRVQGVLSVPRGPSRRVAEIGHLFFNRLHRRSDLEPDPLRSIRAQRMPGPIPTLVSVATETDASQRARVTTRGSADGAASRRRREGRVVAMPELGDMPASSDPGD